MKYIITAKDIFNGDSKNDAMNPLAVTEIATELIITRLYLIILLQEKKINKSDCVVTIEERKCLYSKIFDNVISYKEFEKINDGNLNVIDLLDEKIFDSLSSGPVENRLIPYLPFYRNWERDKSFILDIEWSDLSNYEVANPFVCLVVRKRSAWNEKNMTEEYWSLLLNKLKENKINTYVFGKETESMCDGNYIKYVKNYQDWCTLVKNKNCKRVISTMTGGVYPCLIFGNSEIKMTIIDNTNLMEKFNYDPSFYHECINFSKIDIEFINYIPKTEEIYERITKNL